MSRLLIISLLTAALAVCGLAPAAGASTGGWSATHTQALKLEGRLLGAAPAAQQLKVSVAPAFAQHILDQFHDRVGRDTHARTGRRRVQPDVACSVSAVEQYLRLERLHLRIRLGRSYLLVTALRRRSNRPSRRSTRAISTSRTGRPVRVRKHGCGAGPVGARLSADVSAVLGLSDVPIAVPEPGEQTTPPLPRVHAEGGREHLRRQLAPPRTDADRDGDHHQRGHDPDDRAPSLRRDPMGLPQVPVNVVYDGPEAGIVETTR